MNAAAAVDLRASYERAREYVGHAQRVPLGLIRARDFQRLAMAVGDLAAEYFDEAAASEAGHASVVAPLMYLTAVLGWEAGPPESELLPDGNAREPLGAVPVDGLRLMGGGQQITFFEPVVGGMHVTMEVLVDDVELKEGREGPMLLLRVRRRYVDERGLLLLECHETFIGR